MVKLEVLLASRGCGFDDEVQFIFEGLILGLEVICSKYV